MAALRPTSALKPHPKLGPGGILPPLTAEEYAGLKESIRADGIKQQIVVTRPGMVILDGHHRWRVATELGIEEVPVMFEETGDDADHVRLGLSLNIARRHMTGDQKRAAAAALLKANPEQSNRSVAASVGIHHETVEAVRRDMESTGEIRQLDARLGQDGKERPAHAPRPKPKPPASWKPERAKKAEEILGSMPEGDRAASVSIVDSPGIPDVKGVELLQNLADMEPEERTKVLELGQSDDPRDRSLAVSKAAKAPANADPRCAILDGARVDTKKALRWCDRDDSPEFADEIREIIRRLGELSERIDVSTRSKAA